VTGVDCAGCLIDDGIGGVVDSVRRLVDGVVGGVVSGGRLIDTRLGGVYFSWFLIDITGLDYWLYGLWEGFWNIIR